MLGKLIKYELRSTGRTFLPMYLLLLVFAVMSRFSLGRMGNIEGGDGLPSQILNFIMGVSVAGYAFIIMGTMIVTFVVVVTRFYKNLTGNEGYLMHTLPVSTNSLIQAKLVTAFIWEAASCGMVFLSVFLLLVQPSFFGEFAKLWSEVIYALEMVSQMVGAGRLTLTVVLFIIATITSALTGTMMIYASIAIGHTFKKHRVMGAVGAYIGLSMICQVVVGVLVMIMGYNMRSIEVYSMTQGFNAMNSMLGFALVMELAFGFAWYFVTNYVMSSQLNLE